MKILPADFVFEKMFFIENFRWVKNSEILVEIDELKDRKP